MLNKLKNSSSFLRKYFYGIFKNQTFILLCTDMCNMFGADCAISAKLDVQRAVPPPAFFAKLLYCIFG